MRPGFSQTIKFKALGRNVCQPRNATILLSTTESLLLISKRQLSKSLESIPNLVDYRLNKKE